MSRTNPMPRTADQTLRAPLASEQIYEALLTRLEDANSASWLPTDRWVDEIETMATRLLRDAIFAYRWDELMAEYPDRFHVMHYGVRQRDVVLTELIEVCQDFRRRGIEGLELKGRVRRKARALHAVDELEIERLAAAYHDDVGTGD